MAKTKTPSGQTLNPLLPPEEQKNITKIEYISLIISRIGGMFGTTLTGTLAATFLYELFFADFPQVGTEQIAAISARQITISTVLGIIMPLVAGTIVQKWKTKWGRYRQWYLIIMIPYFLMTISFYWVPKGWTVDQMAWLRYGIAAFQTVLNAFNTLSQNIIQVITPNGKEKKTLATLWQISYYLGYGLAYLSPEIFKLFIPKGDPRYANRYVVLTLFAAGLTLIGNMMVGMFCRERIELPKQEKKEKRRVRQQIDTLTWDSEPVYLNKRRIAKCILLCIPTCGLYYAYWKYLLVQSTRLIKKDHSSCIKEWLCLLLVPFYNLYWWYTRGQLLKDELDQHGYSAKGNGIVCLILSLFGLEIVSMAIMQNDFNSLPTESTELTTTSNLFLSVIQMYEYRNYRAYQYFTWVNVFAGLGKWSTLLAGITVGSSHVILLTVPTAAGTVVGNVICGVIARKKEPTKILKFCGLYSITAAVVLFGLCYGEKVAGINFWEGGTAIFFYIFYFLFGVGVGFQELSMSHYTVEYMDYLEWQTGERMEAVQGIIPGWINSAFTYAKDILIPYILVWIAYPTNDDSTRELVDVIQERIASGVLSRESYLNTCLWLLAFLLFGYALTNLLRAAVLKFFYDVEGEKKEQMYKELEEIRKKRHEENETVAAAQ